MPGYADWGFELIERVSSDLSADVESRIRAAREAEDAGSTARNVFDVIVRNVELSRGKKSPICQDTGLVNFFVHAPADADVGAIRGGLTEAARRATKEGLLRPNAVHPVSGKNSGDNVGDGLPYFSFETHDRPEVVVDLLLKGGGSENCGAQYTLPDRALDAGRDLKGVERCVLDAVFKAQGFGCGPGVLGVCIGGDRTGGFAGAKKQLLRSLDDTNPDPALATLEATLLAKSNELGIGPMGFGGKTTVLAVKIGTAHRHPASFFVSIAYSCWADRRRRMTVTGDSVEFR
jgi:fumarate hydratase class I